MNRFTSRSTGIAAALVGLLAIAACIEGPAGPAGPAGAAGADGAVGATGAAGADANQTCTECHVSDTRIRVRQLQWENSGHAVNGDFRRSSSASCAGCHSHEGFIDRMESGNELSSQGFDDPSPQNCRTCHNIHETYTAADWARRGSAPHDLWLTGTTVDLGENGNLCAQCHQPRTSYPIPVVGGGDYTFTSTRLGPHHGPQSSTLVSVGGYEVTGSKTIPSAAFVHGDKAVNEDGCATCHMAKAYGDLGGGHTNKMWTESRGVGVPTTDGCEECHSSAGDWDDFDHGGVQTTVDGLIAQLETKLIAAGITTAASPTRSVPGTYSEAVAGAYWNYITAIEDQSHGVHNPTYIIAILTNALEALP